jgi:DNA invertase Pin-like site-specific DNA recombinase
MTVIGYARCSTVDQKLDLQTDALKAAGCTKLFVEHASGTDKDRPQLAKCLAYVRKGDVLVVWKLDRAARSVEHLIAIVEDLKKREVDFKSLKDAIDTTTAVGKLSFHIFAAFAEFERNVIRERTLAGMAAAKARGVITGRPKGYRKVDGIWQHTVKGIVEPLPSP